jgi:sRNA-binding protein
MLLQTRFPREHLDESIRQLAARYPSCFFESPKLRRPLKAAIETDLQKDGIGDEVIAAVQFYKSNWSYQRALQAGAERLDLSGKKAGTVTEQEQRTAQNRIRVEQEERTRKDGSGAQRASPVSTLLSLHAVREASAAQPSAGLEQPSEERDFNHGVTEARHVPAESPKAPAPLARLQAILQSASDIAARTEDETLQTALIVAALRVLIGEAEKAIATLGGTST